MTTQRRNSEQVELLRADFFARREPNAAWSHTVSDHLLLPGLHCFWPTSAHHDTHQAVYVDDIACDYDLTMTNTPVLQLWSLGLPPCVQFTAANSQYLTYADDGQFDILGTETHIIAAQRGLALGGWFRFSALANLQGMMSKWISVGNQRSYRIYKDAANHIVFEISSLGTAITAVAVTSAGTVAADTWYHIFARFVPSTAMDIYIDAVPTTLAVGVPASIWHSNAAFAVGRTDGANYANMYASLMHLCASSCWDGNAATRNVIPFALFEHSRTMFKG